MRQLSMLVTAQGEWVIEGSPQFLAALGDPDPDYDATLFAVKNLGFIKLQALDDTVVEIELHPRNVGLAALLAVQQQILVSRAKLIRLKYLDTAWHSEITSSTEHAISRISELCAHTFAPPSTDKYVVEPQEFSDLFRNEASPFRPMAQKWRASFNYFDETLIPFAIKHQLLSRTIIVGLRSREADPVFRFIGDGFRWVGEDYYVNGIGEKVQNQPDRDYGGWVSEFYKTAARSGRPRYDLITAAVRWEDEPGKPYRASRYERLLLPWRTASDEMFVTIFSRILGNDPAASAAPSLSDHSVSIKVAKSS